MAGSEHGRMGRPRYPATALERVFIAHGIDRAALAHGTGYTPNYVGSVLRGTLPFNRRFAGTVALQWPELTGELRPFLEGDGDGREVSAGTEV